MCILFSESTSPTLFPQQSVLSSPIGGEFLTDCLMKSLESKGITVSDFLNIFLWDIECLKLLYTILFSFGH